MKASPAVPGDESDPLDQMICFALYAAARATNRCYVSLLKPWGLTYPQYLVLVLMWTRKSLSVKDVAEQLKLDSGTTSPLIRRLVARGFLTKERSLDDERAVVVSITESGEALRKELDHIPERVAEAAKLTLADGNSALSFLRDVASNLASASVPGEPAAEK